MTEEYIGPPGLRGKIVDIICEEWPNSDNEIVASTISERLQSEGVEASEQAVGDMLLRLAAHGDIDLVLANAPPTTVDMTIRGVRQGLCE